MSVSPSDLVSINTLVDIYSSIIAVLSGTVVVNVCGISYKNYKIAHLE
jgi:hypothetical protein